MLSKFIAYGLLAQFTLTIAPPVAGAQEGTSKARWISDYDSALAIAKAEGKDLLVEFTGSDWCIPCKKLHKEVLTQPEWVAAASKEYVLVALDFPQGEELRSKVPDPERNEALKVEFGVRGFPAIFLMNPDGVAYAQTTYLEGGHAKYQQHLAQIAATGRRHLAVVPSAMKAFDEAAEGEAKWAAWTAVLGHYQGLEAGSPFCRSMAGAIRWGFDSEPSNATGRRAAAARALIDKRSVDDELFAYAEAEDPSNKDGLFERALDGMFKRVESEEAARFAVAALDRVNRHGFRDAEVGFTLNHLAARWFNRVLADEERKAHFAQVALRYGTEDAEILEFLRGAVR